MKNIKLKLVSLFAFSSLFLSLFVSLLYIYDPMMFFHKNYFRELTISDDMRVFSPGAIRHFEHDSYILGTSMMVNSSSSLFSEELGGNFANLSMDGSDFFEREYPLKMMLEKGAKTIVFSMDAQYLDQQRGKKEYPKEFLDSIYSNDIERIRYYFNVNTLLCALSFSSSSFCIGDASSFEHPSEWFSDKAQSARFGGVENWLSSNSSQINKALSNICEISEYIKNGIKKDVSEEDIVKQVDNAKEYVYTHLLKYVDTASDTNFVLVFPPYSRVRFAEWYQYDIASSIVHVEVIKYLVQVSSRKDNLEVYAFEDMAFIDALENYKDPNHHSKEISNVLTSYIGRKRGLLTEDNLDEFLIKAKDLALEFDYQNFSKPFCSKLNYRDHL